MSDIEATKERNIAVCNVVGYSISVSYYIYILLILFFLVEHTYV